MRKKKISSRRAAIPVRALDFVMYNTKDIRRARAFYQKVFGLKRGEEWNEHDENTKAKVCVLGTTVVTRLFGTEDLALSPQGNKAS